MSVRPNTGNFILTKYSIGICDCKQKFISFPASFFFHRPRLSIAPCPQDSKYARASARPPATWLRSASTEENFSSGRRKSKRRHTRAPRKVPRKIKDMGFDSRKAFALYGGFHAHIGHAPVCAAVDPHLCDVDTEGRKQFLRRRRNVDGGKPQTAAQMFSVNHRPQAK